MRIPVVWKSYKEDTPNRGYWDEGLLEYIFSGEDFWHEDKMVESGGAIVIIPARSHSDKVDEINEDIKNLDWVLIILAGDEENVFPIDKLKHKCLLVYQMTPDFNKPKIADRYLGDGWPPDARELIGKNDGVKDYDWAFSGQITHKRRKLAAKFMHALLEDEQYKGFLNETERFTEGLSRKDYYELLSRTKIAICPSGPETPDTFRFYEALEAGCVPIVDDKIPKNAKATNYWRYLFTNSASSDLPFPILTDWKKLKGVFVNYYDRYPNVNNRVFSWWQQYKKKLEYNIKEDISYLSKTKMDYGLITVLIPTSPIKSNPDTSIIEETILSVRDKLPGSEIILMIDGVREEQKESNNDYQEYIRRILWKTNFEWKKVTPVMFDEFNHQSGMTRKVLRDVKTPLILFVEHDTPLCEYIPWEALQKTILEGDANLIRFHHEALILPDHKHLMLDEQPITINDVPIIRTAQWSQRPHLASTEFYIKTLDKYFNPEEKSFIEDKVHGRVISDYKDRGKAGWNDWKIMVYAPSGDMKRSYHLDGRAGEPMYKNL